MTRRLQIYTLVTETTHLQSILFFFNDTATTEIYTLSLHDALPISSFGLEQREELIVYLRRELRQGDVVLLKGSRGLEMETIVEDRKSTRLNSSHANISYAVFCLKKKNSDDHTS